MFKIHSPEKVMMLGKGKGSNRKIERPNMRLIDSIMKVTFNPQDLGRAGEWYEPLNVINT